MPTNLVHVTDSFSRPANTTAYTANDLVANSATAGSVTPLKFNIGQGGFRVAEVHIQKSGTTVTSADFDLYLYGSSPTPANGDNGAWSTDLADFIGIAQGGAMTAFTDGAMVVNPFAIGGGPTHYAANGVIYGLLVAQAGYTPASGETFTVELEVEKL